MITSLPDDLINYMLNGLRYKDIINYCSTCIPSRRLFCDLDFWKEKVHQLRPHCNVEDKKLFDLIKLYGDISTHGSLNIYQRQAISGLEPVVLSNSFPQFTEVISVACGYEHIAIVTIQGYIYTLGSNYFGQLGLNILGGSIANLLWFLDLVM